VLASSERRDCSGATSRAHVEVGAPSGVDRRRWLLVVRVAGTLDRRPHRRRAQPASRRVRSALGQLQPGHAVASTDRRARARSRHRRSARSTPDRCAPGRPDGHELRRWAHFDTADSAGMEWPTLTTALEIEPIHGADPSWPGQRQTFSSSGATGRDRRVPADARGAHAQRRRKTDDTTPARLSSTEPLMCADIAPSPKCLRTTDQARGSRHERMLRILLGRTSDVTIPW
jgi:hypothetical protein